jgi:hypothetical protein
MSFTQHHSHGLMIAELNNPDIRLTTAQEFLQMMMDSGAEGVIVHASNLDERFFDLRTGLAGDMLQKVVNYRLRLAIVGDFSAYESNSLMAFITESNRSNTIAFVSSVEEALMRWA